MLTGAAVKESRDETLLECIPQEIRVSYGFSGVIRPWLAGAEVSPDGRTPPPAAQSPKKSSSSRDSTPSTLARLWRRFKPKNLQYWLPFDRYWLDTRAGTRAARQLIRDEGIEVIHVSADPWAPLVSAYHLSRDLGIPLVVDFRDPWSTHQGKMALRPAITRWWIRRFEARLFAQASAIILNTETARDVYIDHYAGRIPAERFYAVRNAFDLGLFYANAQEDSTESDRPHVERGAQLEPTKAPFTALYFGRFRAFVSPDLLFEGFSRFVQRRQLTPHDAQLKLVGALSDEHLDVARHFEIVDYLDVHPPVPFRESLPILQGASTLLLVIEPDCYMQIPGKLYDYFAAARPIIALSANEEANRMISDVGMGAAIAHNDLDSLVHAFDEVYERWLDTSLNAQAHTADAVAPYSAHEQARQIASIYDAICPESDES